MTSPTDPTDDPTPLPTDPSTEDGERRLRKVLGTVDDLEPPRDDLFAQRALLRGRARTSRRRTSVLGAAAAVVVVGAVGGAWVAAQQGGLSGSSTSAAAGSAVQERASDGDAQGASGGDDGGAGAPATSPAASAPAAPSPPTGAPTDLPTDLSTGLPTTALPPGDGVSPARDGSTWFTGAVTPQRTAFATVEERLATDFADVFAGAYDAPSGGGRIVVTETRRDPALEALVRSAMPSPTDVDFAVVANSYAAQRALADRVVADAASWRAQGVDITGVRLDGPSNRVLVSASEGLTPGVLARHYGGDVLAVEVAADVGKRPDGTLATLQQ